MGQSSMYPTQLVLKYADRGANRFSKRGDMGAFEDLDHDADRSTDRFRRTMYALLGLGGTMAGSVFIMVVGSFMALFCTVRIFRESGAVILLITCLSAMVAFVALPAALFCAGPLRPGRLPADCLALVQLPHTMLNARKLVSEHFEAKNKKNQIKRSASLGLAALPGLAPPETIVIGHMAEHVRDDDAEQSTCLRRSPDRYANLVDIHVEHEEEVLVLQLAGDWVQVRCRAGDGWLPRTCLRSAHEAVMRRPIMRSPTHSDKARAKSSALLEEAIHRPSEAATMTTAQSTTVASSLAATERSTALQTPSLAATERSTALQTPGATVLGRLDAKPGFEPSLQIVQSSREPRP